MKELYADQAGLTLVELVMAIVVIAIGFAGVLSVYLTTIKASADPIIQRQAIAVADAYLDEILGKAYSDPDGVNGETARQQFDDVNDYTNLPDTRVRNQFGQTVSGLEDYRVDVDIQLVTLGAPSVPALRVQVAVSHPTTAGATVTGFRTEY